ncbi:solute carrier family 23 protein [Streptomyces sp. NPDC056367]|uniref:solute carrier family 23 protein n=1 Tax=Streptomyces sp. NPDC056367 TaxID=3345797 RepID=UPI0035E2C83B
MLRPARTPGAPTHPVDENLPARALVPAALQHVAGLATIAQTLGPFGIGARLPLTNGGSFAVVAPVLAASASATGRRADALPEIFGATLVAGAVCFAPAPAFCRPVRFFPPVVSGFVITLGGLSLLSAAGTWARGGSTEAAGYGSLSNLALSAATAFGPVPVVASDFYERLPAPAATVPGSGITAGCLVAVLLNYLLNHLGHPGPVPRSRSGPPTSRAPPTSPVRAVRTDGPPAGPSPAAIRPRPPPHPRTNHPGTRPRPPRPHPPPKPSGSPGRCTHCTPGSGEEPWRTGDVAAGLFSGARRRVLVRRPARPSGGAHATPGMA